MTEPQRAAWIGMLGYLGRLRYEQDQIAPTAFPLTIPHVGADEAQLAGAEARIGRPLDAHQRELLAVANGWSRMFLDVNLLGTDDLGAGDLWGLARERIDLFHDEPLPEGFPPREELLPLAVAGHDATLFVIWTNGPVTDDGHPVIWLHDEEIERYSSVREWLDRAIERTKRQTAKLQQDFGG